MMKTRSDNMELNWVNNKKDSRNLVYEYAKVNFFCTHLFTPTSACLTCKYCCFNQGRLKRLKKVGKVYHEVSAFIPYADEIFVVCLFCHSNDILISNVSDRNCGNNWIKKDDEELE